MSASKKHKHTYLKEHANDNQPPPFRPNIGQRTIIPIITNVVASKAFPPKGLSVDSHHTLSKHLPKII